MTRRAATVVHPSGTGAPSGSGGERGGPPRRRRVPADVVGAVAVVVALHLIGFGTVLFVVVPHHITVGSQVFGLGLAATAYVLGLRHAFDPDHIAAIDNTTRTIVRRGGRRPRTIGMWFSLGHSAVVLVLSALIAWGAHLATTLTSENSSLHRELGVAGTGVSGFFLLLLGTINLLALVGIVKAFSAMRTGRHSDAELEEILTKRGFFARILQPIIRRVVKPWQIFPVGFLFGLGFDTASEVALLVLAGTGAASGVPWYAVLALPVVFAAGMCLMDTADGIFMGAAYDWAFAKPVRTIYYNLSVTALSVAVAFFVGGIEIIQILHDDLHLTGPVVDMLAGIRLDEVGYVIVGMFLVTWVVAAAVYKVGHFDDRWSSGPPRPSGPVERVG